MKTVIDLHGVKHADVPRIIENACSQHEIPFIVITGKSDMMKKIVEKAASEFNLLIRDVVNNPGRILVYESG